MEVPRLGVESGLQLLVYTTATATQNRSHICKLHHSSWQPWILNPLSEAREQTRNLMVPGRIVSTAPRRELLALLDLGMPGHRAGGRRVTYSFRPTAWVHTPIPDFVPTGPESQWAEVRRCRKGHLLASPLQDTSKQWPGSASSHGSGQMLSRCLFHKIGGAWGGAGWLGPGRVGVGWGGVELGWGQGWQTGC